MLFFSFIHVFTQQSISENYVHTQSVPLLTLLVIWDIRKKLVKTKTTEQLRPAGKPVKTITLQRRIPYEIYILLTAMAHYVGQQLNNKQTESTERSKLEA